MPYKRISDLQDGTLESGSYVPIDKSEGTTQRYDLYELQNVVEGYLYNGTFYADSGHSEAITGEAGKIYIDLPNGDSYRWTGSQYALIAHVYDDATTSTHGLMSAADKAKLDGIASGATANSPYTSNPQMDGTASAGSSANFSRGDHVHPTDTTRAPLASPHLTGTPTAPTAASGTNSTQIATTAFTQAEIASHAYSLPTMDATTKGGAKLEAHGGLALRDGSLGIGSLVQQSDGYARGGLAEVTAKGHAEQDGTPTPDNPVPIQVVRGRNLLDESNPSTIFVDVSISEVSQASGVTSYIAKVDKNTIYTISAKNANRKIVSGTGSTVPSVGLSATVIVYDSDNATTPTAFNSGDNEYLIVHLGSSSYVVSEPQLTLGSTPQPYVPYGHVGMEVQGRNLLKTPYAETENSQITKNGVTFTVNNDGSIKCRGTATANTPFSCADHVDLLPILENGKTYTVSGSDGGVTVQVWSNTLQIKTGSFTWNSSATNSNCSLYIYSGTTVDVTIYPMLNEGATALPYQPYYHETRAIPLPQRGWVAGLPDGTADSLRLDGAGKVTWELKDDEVVYDGSSDENWIGGGRRCSINKRDMAYPPSDSAKLNAFSTAFPKGSNSSTYNAILGFGGGYQYKELHFSDGTGAMVLADWKTYLAAHPVTVLYPLATPVTEDCGYVEDWPTDIPEGTTIDIPELSEVGIKYFIDSSVTELAKQWYARANSEYEDRLQALEEAVATIITGS